MKDNAMANRKGQQGVAAVEFALLLIPLLIMLGGITEFGRAMYYYNTIAKTVRDATRLMSTQAPSDPDYATLWANARCNVVYGNPTCSGETLVPGLTTAMVSLCDPVACPGTHASVPMGTGVANLVTVTVGGGANPYTFQSLAAFVPALESFAFAPISASMRQVI